ncbi:hypothetical protein BS78_04G172600 [Paspalum vaginatum]|nr:hypothetical protein BS78_04G172600 [Paspalum vaginatum]
MEKERTPPAAKRARSSPPPQAHVSADAEDRLSALDDGTLHAILARVPLRDAAATTALSRRWPRVFATLPRLVLRPATFNRRGFPDEGYCEDARRWMGALRRVLDGHAVPVAAFEVDVKFIGLYDDCVTNAKYDQCFDLPSPVYSCKTLTSLHLYNWRLRVPSRLTGLRAVRSIQLSGVAASDDDIRRFISRCSALERLEIFGLHKERNIFISAPCLENLLIYSHRPLRVSVKKAPRLDKTLWTPIDEMLDYEKMAEREHDQTDEIGNMALSMYKVFMPKRLPKKNCLLGLEMLILAVDHNHKVFASLVSCLLNSSPNLKHLRIVDSRYWGNRVPLPAKYWQEQINADSDLNHLSSVSFFIDEIFEGHPCGGFCRFLVAKGEGPQKDPHHVPPFSGEA